MQKMLILKIRKVNTKGFNGLTLPKRWMVYGSSPNFTYDFKWI